MGRISCSYLFLALGLICAASCCSTGQSNLRVLLRRALPDSGVAMCVDKPECKSQPGICNEDADLALALCPALCGGCVCEDNAATEGSCPSLVPDVCEGDLAVSLCPKTCGLCGNQNPTCFDHVIGLTCDALPNPCNDTLGQVACPKYCGLCKDAPQTTQTALPTTTPTTPMDPGTTAAAVTDPCSNTPCLNQGVCNNDPSTSPGYTCMCPSGYSGWICQIRMTTTPPPVTFPGSQGTCNATTNKNNVACVPSEVIFMVEYAASDSYSNGVDHETDFVRELAEAWARQNRDARIGVVVYHDTVREAIHITDYKNDISGLKNRLDRLSRELRPSGSADLGRALDFVRENSFKDARPNAEKIVIPIVHNMNDNTKDKIVPAAMKLKAMCAVIVGINVYSYTIDRDIMSEMVSQPYADYYTSVSSHYALEETAKYFNNNDIKCPSP